MNIRTVKYDRLTNEEIVAWSTIQRAEPALASPFFRPEFTEAVAAVRDDVEVAVLEDNGSSVGFFPFQRTRWNAAEPVGGMLSDFQDLIAAQDVHCDPIELLRACGLTAFHFNHLLSSRAIFAPFIWRVADSPYVDVSGGMDKYLESRANGRRIMSEFRQGSRKLARELGPVRYDANVLDRGVVSTFIAWKSDQYRRTGARDIFEYRWVRDLLDKILEFGREDFAPVVSVLHAGDSIAAINFGIRCRTVLHPWFPTYNVALSNHSPGYLHWIEMIAAAETQGIHRIDFGRGTQPYKLRLMSAADRVAEGTVDVRAAAGAIRNTLRNTRERLRSSPLAAPVRVPVRITRRLRHWAGCAISNMGRQAKRVR
jgi:CelD/BcsL family acetyltransferase involved in cellulose biosynthesis